MSNPCHEQTPICETGASPRNEQKHHSPPKNNAPGAIQYGLPNGSCTSPEDSVVGIEVPMADALLFDRRFLGRDVTCSTSLPLPPPLPYAPPRLSVAEALVPPPSAAGFSLFLEVTRCVCGLWRRRLDISDGSEVVFVSLPIPDPSG